MTKEEILELLLKLEEATSCGDISKLWLENPNVQKCWEIKGCQKKRCPAYGRNGVRCWHVAGTFCRGDGDLANENCTDKLKDCRNCEVFKGATGSYQLRLTELINNLVFYMRSFDPASLSIIKVKNKLKEITVKFKLTVREKEVLLLLLERYSRKDIAKALLISTETVKMHSKNLYKKLGVNYKRDLFDRLQKMVEGEDI